VVRKKNRRAVGSEDSKEKVGLVGDHRVSARPLLLPPGPIGDDDLGGVDLVNGRKLGLGKQRSDGKAAISRDRLGIVTTSKTDVEPRTIANRDPTAPAEEAVRQVAQ
jgi:hypothetical protein